MAKCSSIPGNYMYYTRILKYIARFLNQPSFQTKTSGSTANFLRYQTHRSDEGLQGCLHTRRFDQSTNINKIGNASGEINANAHGSLPGVDLPSSA
jgi:hypothetical protein